MTALQASQRFLPASHRSKRPLGPKADVHVTSSARSRCQIRTRERPFRFRSMPVGGRTSASLPPRREADGLKSTHSGHSRGTYAAAARAAFDRATTPGCR